MNRNFVLTGVIIALVFASPGVAGNLADLVTRAHGERTPPRPAPLVPFTIPLDPDPYWSSPSFTGSLWGAILVDFAGDGYPDVFTVLEQGKCYLYKNNEGDVESEPSWQSNDVAYNIWPAVGDYDNDGDLDVAIACYSFVGGRTKVYANQGGTLTEDPVWTAVSGGGTVCDWGDVDSDGDLDLAIADMFANPGVFINDSGTLSPAPLWTGTDYNLDFAVAWLDVDNDGDLDLAVTGINAAVPALRVYTNSNGTLERTATWTSTVNAGTYTGAFISVHDLNRDGWLDVALSNGFINNQPNIIFMNRDGVLERAPSWISTDPTQSGGGRFGDLDADGDLDWAVNNGSDGAVYENQDTVLARTPAWQSNPGGGLGLDIADMDGDGVETVRDTFVATDTRHLLYLSAAPVQTWTNVRLNGTPLADSQYCWNPLRGWVSLADPLTVGDTVICEYVSSTDLEFLLSDGTGAKAHLFLNAPVGVAELPPARVRLPRLHASPNPFTDHTTITGTGTPTAVYDANGRLVGTSNGNTIGSGLVPGIYFVRAPGCLPVTVTKVSR